MFTESLLESQIHSHRRWPTALSFAAQSLAVAALLALPFVYTEALPKMVALGPQIGPPPGEPLRAEAQPSRTTATNTTSEIVGTTVQMPLHIPNRVSLINDSGQAPAQPDIGFYVHGSPGISDSGRSLMSLVAAPHVPSPPSPAPTRRYTVSGGVSQGLLIHQVKPSYPPLALTSRTQGAVVLAAVINKSGVIENLRVISGHPLLVRAAVEAVQQWRYRPYLLNGEPVEIETQITVNFTLGNN